jgi:general secretion pathway protein H
LGSKGTPRERRVNRQGERHARDCRPASGLSRWPIPRFRSCARDRAQGFTLIELIAVIVLLAIVLSVVTFSFSKSLHSARIRGASRDLVAALRYTRGQAIVKGQQEVLLLNVDTNSYTAPGKGAVKLPEDMTLRLTTAEQEQTGASTGGIRFFADGSSTGGHVSVFQGQREWRVNVAWLTGDIALDEQPE